MTLADLRYRGNPVSTQAVRKWLSGSALPSQDKIRASGLWLEVSAHWLRFRRGRAKGRAAAADSAAADGRIPARPWLAFEEARVAERYPQADGAGDGPRAAAPGRQAI